MNKWQSLAVAVVVLLCGSLVGCAATLPYKPSRDRAMDVPRTDALNFVSAHVDQASRRGVVLPSGRRPTSYRQISVRCHAKWEQFFKTYWLGLQARGDTSSRISMQLDDGATMEALCMALMSLGATYDDGIGL